MALVKFGGGIVQMLGSIGGTVFARNASGNYARAKTKPVDPSSQYQQAVRSAIAVLTEYWRETLTEVQRVAWATYAAAVAMQNRLGETIHLSGINHFIRSNAHLAVQGYSLVANGPIILSLPSMDPAFAITATEAGGTISATFDDGFDWLDEDNAYLIIRQGVPQNITRNFFAGPYRYMYNIPGDSGTPPVTPAVMSAPFTLIEGQRVWCSARILRADGRLSSSFTALCDIGA